MAASRSSVMRTEGRARVGAGPDVGAGSERVRETVSGSGPATAAAPAAQATVGSIVEGPPEQSYAFPIGPLIRRVSPPAYRTWYLRRSSGVGLHRGSTAPRLPRVHVDEEAAARDGSRVPGHPNVPDRHRRVVGPLVVPRSSTRGRLRRGPRRRGVSDAFHHFDEVRDALRQAYQRRRAVEHRADGSPCGFRRCAPAASRSPVSHRSPMRARPISPPTSRATTSKR